MPNYIFQSTKKCKMMSFYMTSLHVDLKEAARCVDIIPPTLLVSLSHLRTLVQNKNATIFGLTYEDSSFLFVLSGLVKISSNCELI